MDELLQQELAPLVKVRIGKKSYPLAFPMAAVILYKQKTGDVLLKVDTWLGINSELPEGDPQRLIFRLHPLNEPEKFSILLLAGMYGGEVAKLPEGSAIPPVESFNFPSIGRVRLSTASADRIAQEVVKALVPLIMGTDDSEEVESNQNPLVAGAK